MPVCQSCKLWTNGQLLMDITCASCVSKFMEQAQINAAQNPTGHSNRLKSIPPPPPRPSPSTHMMEIRAPAIAHSVPNASSSENQSQTASSSLDHAGAKAYSRQLARESRMGKAKDPPKSNKETKVIECALMLYQDDILIDKKGLFRKKQLVNLQDPNLYEKLSSQLWHLFSPLILEKTDIEVLPTSVRSCISLSQGEAEIPNQETLTGIIKATGPRKKMQLDLMYHHPQEENATKVNPTRISTQVTTRARKLKGTSQMPKTWALGGNVATQPAQGDKGLSTHLARLSKPVHSSTTIHTDQWIKGKRLQFYTDLPPCKG